MKAREDRRKVMIKARMRSSSAWQDVCILNVSAHGLGIDSAGPPALGAYVEICRGQQIIIARVAWTDRHRAGLRSQDPISFSALVNDSADTSQHLQPHSATPVERRRAPRVIADAHANARVKSRALEFVCFATIGGAFAAAAVSTANQALMKPMSSVNAALDSALTDGSADRSSEESLADGRRRLRSP